jgi:hypothetical protein
MPSVFPLNWDYIDYSSPGYKFMAGVAVPEMAALLGYDPYDAKTNTGFGCYGCHQY